MSLKNTRKMASIREDIYYSRVSGNEQTKCLCIENEKKNCSINGGVEKIINIDILLNVILTLFNRNCPVKPMLLLLHCSFFPNNK